jgi:hypothetical protein
MSKNEKNPALALPIGGKTAVRISKSKKPPKMGHNTLVQCNLFEIIFSLNSN